MQQLQHIKLSFKCPKQLNDLQPCNGDWYCDGCHKIVRDFRGISEQQILHAISGSQTVCGMFEADRVEILPQKAQWFRWTSAAMMFLGLTSCQKDLYLQTLTPADTYSNKTPVRSVVQGKMYAGGSVEQAIKDLPPEIVFGGAEIEPEFVGGEIAFVKYLHDNLKDPQHLKGKAYAQFMVEKDGSITNVNIIRTDVPSLNNEVDRVLKTMPKWKPGIQNGKPYRVQYTIPIKFDG